MKSFSKLILSAALMMGSFSGSLFADSFAFSYVFDGSDLGAPGSFSGTLTGTQSGSYVTILSVDTLVVNGVQASGTIFNASYDSMAGDFTNSGSAVVSFTLGLNNFLFINSDYANEDLSGDTYAWLAFDYFPQAYAARPEDGSGHDTNVSNDTGIGQWSLVNTTPAVPEGGATLCLLGLALVGFAAVRRTVTAR